MLIPSVRKIHNRNSSKVIGLSFSYKMGEMLAWESTLERDWLLCLEANPLVFALGVQPRKFKFCYEGKWHSYTPDVEVRWRDSTALPTMYEVKPCDLATSSEFIRRAAVIRVAMAAKGYRFEIVTEREIRAEPRLANLKFLKHYADVLVTQHERSLVTQALLTHGSCELRAIAQQLRGAGIGLPSLYRMLWDGSIAFPSTARVSPALVVFPFLGGV